MGSALDVVKGVYDRFSVGDLDGFLALCDEHIEWVVNGPATLEKCNAFHGRAGVRKFLDVLGGSWEFKSFKAQEFIAAGSTVVVLGEEAGKDKNSKTSFENRWAHVFDVKDGKITRFREFLCHWTGEQHPPKMSWGEQPGT